MERVAFVVEEAGCDSCAALLRETFAPFGDVERIDVDEQADCAEVRIDATAALSPEAVETALAEASRTGGHAYRLRSDSWRADRP